MFRVVRQTWNHRLEEHNRNAASSASAGFGQLDDGELY